MLPVSGLSPSCRIYDGSRAGYHQVPATVVPLHRTGIERWSYAVSAPGSGVLVCRAQAYDPLWRLSVNGRAATAAAGPVPARPATPSRRPAPWQHRLHRRVEHCGGDRCHCQRLCAATADRGDPPPATVRQPGPSSRSRASATPGRGRLLSRWRRLLRRTMDFCVSAGPWLLALCPAATLAGLSGLLLPLSLGALLAAGAAALLAPAVPVDEPAGDPGAAGLGQDAGDRAEPGTGRGHDDENRAGPGDSSEPAGPGEGPVEPDGEQAGPGGGPSPSRAGSGS